MNRKTTFGLLLLGFVVTNCQKIQQDQLHQDAQLMASLECEARQLKNERFNAANEIRFMEDSLARHKVQLSVAQSAKIDSLKTSYTLRTGQLAEKITKKMDSLFTATYHRAEERQQLDDEIEKVLKTICH